jgi:hypothetical protein
LDKAGADSKSPVHQAYQEQVMDAEGDMKKQHRVIIEEEDLVQPWIDQRDDQDTFSSHGIELVISFW